MKKSKVIVVLVISILVTSLLLVLSRTIDATGPLENTISVIDNVVAKPFQLLEAVKEDTVHLVASYKENEELKHSLYEMNQKQSEVLRLEEENEQLRSLLEMKSSINAAVSLTADVVFRHPSSWLEELSINAGEVNGLKSGMLVIGQGGLIGSLVDVQAHSSLVNLLTNEINSENISVRIETTKGMVYGILQGYDTKKKAFVIGQLNTLESIQENDKVVTSGLGDHSVPDIPVGTVLSIIEKQDHLTKEILVKPSADLSDLRVVTVVGK
ncbi:rod shape-determining protein MreC [Streptococcus pneumoniae]